MVRVRRIVSVAGASTAASSLGIRPLSARGQVLLPPASALGGTGLPLAARSAGPLLPLEATVVEIDETTTAPCGADLLVNVGDTDVLDETVAAATVEAPSGKALSLTPDESGLAADSLAVSDLTNTGVALPGAL